MSRDEGGLLLHKETRKAAAEPLALERHLGVPAVISVGVCRVFRDFRRLVTKTKVMGI
jgi:hypothetical protein